jgi:hypothetical protein
MDIFLVIFIFSYNPTTLVYPPFGHTMGYHRATPFEVKMLFGKRLSFSNPCGITCCKLISKDVPGPNDDDELTVYCSNTDAHQIIYNKSLTKIGIYGSFGNGRGKFWSPMGIASTPNGDLFVCDMGNNRIVKLRNQGDTLVFVKSIGSFGCDTVEFDDPYGAACDSKGNVYITDMSNDRIQVLSNDGKFISHIKDLDKPTGIAVIDDGDRWNYYRDNFICVIDKNGRRIQKFSLEGKLLAKSEAYRLGLENSKFSSLCIDFYANIYVTDELNANILKFNRNLKFIVSFGRKGVGDKEFLLPKGITIWKRFGQVFVLDNLAIDYYWIGVNGYIKGCFPEVFTRNQPGTTVSFFVTEPCYVKSQILSSDGDTIRNFVREYRQVPFEHYIVWDGRDNNGNLVSPGEYKIEMHLSPTYSSRGYFEKNLETTVRCE